MTETSTLIALLLAGNLLAPAPAPVDVNVGVTVAPPALAVTSPPLLAAVPGSPVFYAPSANYNLFVYGDRYYSFHRNTWFSAASPGSTWNIIATSRVPKPVLAVPATYYKTRAQHTKGSNKNWNN